MVVRVLLFAGARDVVGAPEIDLEVSAPARAHDVLAALCAAHPALAPHRDVLRVAVDGAYARDDLEVTERSEVAIIPPVAGG